MELTENHGARYDIQHSKRPNLLGRNNYKFPAANMLNNVLESIAHQEDENQLRKRKKKPGREMMSIRRSIKQKNQT